MVSLHSDSTPGDLVGQDLGPYRIVKRLGIGGMAQTFEAVRYGPGEFSQRVCLKVVLPFFQSEPSFADLFKHEARLAARLRHTNIVGVIDFGEINGTLYMALQLVDGIDLEALLKSRDHKRLSPEQVALIGREVARALEHAHNPPPGTNGADAITAIIHRDISPSNVLISRMGEVLLTDFGVAKAVTNKWGKQSNVKGKIPYMAPEQLMGEPVDARSDLFSLGVVLFETLTGKHPFERGNEPATIMASLGGEHVPIAELAPDAPAELCETIERLLSPDPAQRPQSASELIELLDSVGSGSLARRELGEIVANTLPSVLKEGTSRVGLTSGTLEEPGLPAQRLSESPPRPPKPAAIAASPRTPERRRIAAWAVLVVAGILAATYALWPKAVQAPSSVEGTQEDRAGSPRSAAGDGAPATDAIPATAQPDGMENPSKAEPTAPTARKATEPPAGKPINQPSKATPLRPARLTVIVFPFGDVWINGKLQGAAPLKNRPLKPGTYELGAGQGSRTKTRTVRLRPGQREQVVFDLTKSEP